MQFPSLHLFQCIAFCVVTVCCGVHNRDTLNQLRSMQMACQTTFPLPTAADLKEWMAWRLWASRQRSELDTIDLELARGERIVFVSRLLACSRLLWFAIDHRKSRNLHFDLDPTGVAPLSPRPQKPSPASSSQAAAAAPSRAPSRAGLAEATLSGTAAATATETRARAGCI